MSDRMMLTGSVFELVADSLKDYLHRHPEMDKKCHAQNPRGLCLWSDELSAWFKNFNRYNNGSEEQFWLSVFNAKPTISDRKSTQGSIFIRRPYISVIGTFVF